MFRLRVQYQKIGRLRYLGHLEVLKTMERVVRRAALPFAISQGFSPRMRIAYSAATPLGMYSYDEYFDLFLTEYIPAKECLRRLQENCPADLMPQHCAYVSNKEASLDSSLVLTEYSVDLYGPSLQKAQASLDALLDADELIVIKKGKEKSLSICDKLFDKPYFEQELSEGSNKIHLSIRTLNRGKGALRLDAFLNALNLSEEKREIFKLRQAKLSDSGEILTAFEREEDGAYWKQEEM